MKNYFMVSSTEGRLRDADEGDIGMRDALHFTYLTVFFIRSIRPYLCPCRSAYCTIFQVQYVIVSIRSEQNVSYVFGCGENL